MFGLTEFPIQVGLLALFYALMFLCFLLVDWKGKTNEGLNLGLAGMGIMGAAAFLPWQVPDSMRTDEFVRSGVILTLGFISFGLAFVAYLTTNSSAPDSFQQLTGFRGWLKGSWIPKAKSVVDPILEFGWHILFGFAGIAWCFGLAQLTVQICLLWR